MTAADLGALIRGLAPAFRDYVHSVLQPVDDRVSLLESQPPAVAGPPGEKGLDGKDGAPGRDGKIENLMVKFDGERTITLCHKNGDPVEGGVITFPAMIYRGIYQEGKTYQPGDVMTWGGHAWHCRKATTLRPGFAPLCQDQGENFGKPEGPQGKDCWVLMVKRGDNGKGVK